MSSERLKFLSNLRSKAGIRTGQCNLTCPELLSASKHETRSETHSTIIEEFQSDNSVEDCCNPSTSNRIYQGFISDKVPNPISLGHKTQSNVSSCPNDSIQLPHVTADEIYVSNEVNTSYIGEGLYSENESEDDRDQNYVLSASSSSDSEIVPLSVLQKKLARKHKISPRLKENTTEVERCRKTVREDTSEAKKKREMDRHKGKEYSTIRIRNNEVNTSNIIEGLNSESLVTESEPEESDDRYEDYVLSARSSSGSEDIRVKQKKMIKKPIISPHVKEAYTKGKRGRKAVKGDTREARKERATYRNEGKEYSTLKGKIIRGRQCKGLERCRKKCTDRIDDESRYKIFEEYWKLGSFDKRLAFTSALILREEKKTRKIDATKARQFNYKYHLKLNGSLFEVCKGCFRKTFDMSNKYIETVIRKTLISGTTLDDKRGRHPPPNKIETDRTDLVREHILSIPAYESHYCRERTGDRKFLPAFYTLRRLYEEYIIWISPQTPVSRKVYESIFHTMNISIKKFSKDTCQQCDKLQCMIRNAKNPIEIEEVTNELSKHQQEAEHAYSAKKQDKEEGKHDQERAVFTFDLQQCLPTPSLTTSVFISGNYGPTT